MSHTPPPLPGSKNLRAASILNTCLPGAGLFYLGQRTVGAVLAGAFLASFLATLTVFLVGYTRYLSIALGENLLEGHNLEEAGAAFHQAWLLGLGGVGLVLYLISTILFQVAKRRVEDKPHNT
jgi:hypothetical protein